MLELAISKRIGAFHLEVDAWADHELLVLFGPSGSGKSQTLRSVAGLTTPDQGHIAVDGESVFDGERGINLAPRRRRLAWVPQGYGLFPHMTVADNIAFGIVRVPDARHRVAELAGLLGLSGLLERYPATLSGGQQQRVALARALAREARVLLLDEPFAALDEGLRSGLREELLRLRRELGLTIVFVTHDLREAHLLADRIAVLDEGSILHVGDRDEVFRRPMSRRVAELTGMGNLLPADGVNPSGAGATCVVAGLPLQCGSVSPAGVPAGGPAFAGIRAERVNLRRMQPDVPPNHMVGRITGEWSYGNTHTVRFEPVGAGPPLTVEIASRPYEVLGVAGQREWLLELPAADLHLMPA